MTRQGQRADQPVPFSHKHHVEGLGLQCQYCHTTVEKSSYAGIPPTKTCMNCHAQIWTDAQLLEPVRNSWATGQSIAWMRVHDLPDYVFFNHEIHVNKGIGCSSLPWARGRDADHVHAELAADGVVPELPSQSGEEPAADQRDLQHGVERGIGAEAGVVRGARMCRRHRRQRGRDVHGDGSGGEVQMAALSAPVTGCTAQMAGTGIGSEDTMPVQLPAGLKYTKFTSQEALGQFLVQHYDIRTPRELTSCEVCHR